MNTRFIKRIITSLLAFIYLVYILITTRSDLTRIVVIPFLMFAISLFMKIVCLMLGKNKIAKVFSKINVVSFFLYYFGFLVYWDYLAIVSNDYILVIFSLLAWIGGIFVAYKKFLELKNPDKVKK